MDVPSTSLKRSLSNCSLDGHENLFRNDSISAANEDGPSGSESPSLEQDEQDAFAGLGDEDDDTKRIAALFAVNQVYLDFVNKMIAKVDRAIERNRELQCLTAQNAASILHHFLLFRTKRQISTHIQKILGKWVQKSCPFSFLFPTLFQGFQWNDARLECRAQENIRNLHCRSLMSDDRNWRKEELSFSKKVKDIIAEKLVTAGVETTLEQKQQWRAQIEQLNRRIIYLRERPDSEILAGSNFEDVDWARISATNFRGTRSINQLRMKWCNECSPKYSKEAWTKEEESTLSELAQRPWINWDVVSDQLGTSRTPFQCFEHFHSLRSQLKDRKPWTTAEDEKLMSLVQTLRVGNEIHWYKIASYIPGRTKYQCEHRYRRSLDRAIKHGRWSIAEDLLLLNTINKYGPQDWQRIAGHIPNRSALQCRDRWINVLDSKRRNKPWLWEEHVRLLFGVKIFGRNNFAKIALLLPGRNNSDVKTRIMALIRFKIMAYEAQVDKREMPDYKVVQTSFLYFKDRRDIVLSKFREFAKDNLGEDDGTQKLGARMGLGSFVLTSSGDQADYSDSKHLQKMEFGKVVNKSGRWVKLIKNPNEYGSDELRLEIQKLPEEQKTQLIDFLRESDVRLSAELEEESQVPDDPDEALTYYEGIITPERMEKLKQLLDEVLLLKTQIVKPTKARKRKAAAMVESMAPKRHTVAIKDRLVDEIQRNVDSINPEDRRSCMLRNLCHFVRKCDDMSAMEKYQREGLRSTGFLAIEAYLRQRLGLHQNVDPSPTTDLDNDEEVLDQKPCTSTATTNSTANKFCLEKGINQLLPPSTATINGVALYKKNMRMTLLKTANLMFPMVDKDRQIESGDEKLDIELPAEVVNSPEYVELKTLMYKMFFLPMMMHTATAPSELPNPDGNTSNK
uniref:snRNA-activating protein complex subunit 4 n=1 Tax=Ditylenchus dipsaci TaxID=166011 RepID=A0A915DVE6_9BILA